jgi:2-amino-4-hydroxy-6-hydroxymethyldihydropteridine diphosphokinase
MSVEQHIACLLLGSNIRPEHYLPLAVQQLHGLLVVERASRVWQTPAVGSEGPSFLNAALRVRTSLAPEALKLEVLRPLEARLGRVRSVDKNAPRTMDVDAVVWDGEVLEPLLWELAHIAVPVAEVWSAPLRTPTGEMLGQVAQRLAAGSGIHLREDVVLLSQP